MSCHLFLVLAALLACARPQPSPDYEHALQLWTRLVQARGFDAAEDPGADEVLALLDRVPKDSLDAAAAADLRKRIAQDRAARAAERARREALTAAAGEAVSASGAGEGAAEPAGREPAGAVARAPGAALPGGLTPGMKIEDVKAAYGDCVEERGPAELDPGDGGTSRPARLLSLREGDCRTRHPALAGQAVVFVDDALVVVSSLANAKRTEVTRTMDLGKLPDGGVGMVTDGGVVPLPVGATLRSLDGGSR
jgi:hypothetical protein